MIRQISPRVGTAADSISCEGRPRAIEWREAARGTALQNQRECACATRREAGGALESTGCCRCRDLRLAPSSASWFQLGWPNEKGRSEFTVHIGQRLKSCFLTGLLQLAPHLTADNADALFAEARGKTRQQIALILARWFPRPDVPPRIQTLGASPSGDGAGAHPGTPSGPSSPNLRSGAEPFRLEPLSAERYRIEFTASTEFRAKLERARELVSHSVSSGNIVVVLERALDELIARELKRRRERASPGSAESSNRARAMCPSKSSAQFGNATAGNAPFTTRRGAVAESDAFSPSSIAIPSREVGRRLSKIFASFARPIMPTRRARCSAQRSLRRSVQIAPERSTNWRLNPTSSTRYWPRSATMVSPSGRRNPSWMRFDTRARRRSSYLCSERPSIG